MATKHLFCHPWSCSICREAVGAGIAQLGSPQPVVLPRVCFPCGRWILICVSGPLVPSPLAVPFSSCPAPLFCRSLKCGTELTEWAEEELSLRSVASEIRSLSHTHRNVCSAAYILVSYVPLQNLSLQLRSDSFAMRWCWGSQMPLWDCSFIPSRSSQLISSVPTRTKSAAWGGRLVHCWLCCAQDFSSALSSVCFRAIVLGVLD